MPSLSYFYQGYIVPASTLIPILSGFIYYSKINKPLRIILIYLCISFIINIIGSILAAYSINNLPLLHFYTIVELVTILFYFKYAFSNKKTDFWIRIIMITFPLLCVINFTFIQSLYEFNTYTRPFEAIIIIIFSGIYLGSQNSEKEEFTRSGRWVASGFLIYFCSSLYQFIFSNVVSLNTTHFVKMIIWNLHATFVLIMYIFFYLAIRNERGKR